MKRLDAVDLALRRGIRALTDALPKGESLSVPELAAAFPDYEPTTISAKVYRMQRAKQLIRTGIKRKYRYASGPEPVADGRVLLKGQPKPHAKGRGFMALSRLEQEDPAAWQRATEIDRAGKRA